MRQRSMLFAKFYRGLIAGITKKQGTVSRSQNARQSCRESTRADSVKRPGYRGIAVKGADKAKQESRPKVVVRDFYTIPFAFTRRYWIMRREALVSRLYKLFNETGDEDIIGFAAAARRYEKKMQSGQVRQDSKQMRVLKKEYETFFSHLMRAAHTVVPGGAALLDQIGLCDKILIYEGNGYNKSPYIQPEYEVDFSAIAAVLDQSFAESLHVTANNDAGAQRYKRGLEREECRRQRALRTFH